MCTSLTVILFTLLLYLVAVWQLIIRIWWWWWWWWWGSSKSTCSAIFTARRTHNWFA